MFAQLAVSLLLCACLAITFASSSRAADDISGTYWLEDSDGSFVLILEDHGRTVRGSMTGDGMTMRLEAQRNGQTLEGRVAGDEQFELGFRAEIGNGRLLVQLVEPGDSGSAATPALVFIRQGGGSGPEAGAQSSAKAGTETGAATGSATGAAPDAAAGAAAASSTAARPASGDEVSLPHWNIRYRRPTGWNVAKQFGHLDLLGSNTDAGGIFISPGLFDSPESAVAELSAILSALGMTGTPVEAPAAAKVGSFEATRAVYDLRDGNGQTNRARFWTLYSGRGTGLLILGMTTPEHYSAMQSRTDGLAASAVLRDPALHPERAAMLVGTWSFSNTTFSPDIANSGSSGAGYEETIVFAADGTFSASSSSYVTGSSGALHGGTTNASSTREGGDNGVYTVLGDQLVLRSAKTGTQMLPFSQSSGQLVINGRTYVR